VNRDKSQHYQLFLSSTSKFKKNPKPQHSKTSCDAKKTEKAWLRRHWMQDTRQEANKQMNKWPEDRIVNLKQLMHNEQLMQTYWSICTCRTDNNNP